MLISYICSNFKLKTKINMKKIKIVSLLIVMIFSIKSFAQDEKNPWAIGVGINMIDVSGYGISKPFDQLKDYIGVKDFNALPVLSRLYVAKYLNKGFTVDVVGALNSIDEIPSGEVSEKTYYSLDFGLRYDLNELFGQTGWFDPYAKFSIGGAWVDSNSALELSPTLGFNTWFNDKVGLNFESAYKTSSLFDANGVGSAPYIGAYHFQHSISLVLKFGAKDTDSDGVLDADDACPQIVGKKELQGCPDMDGDGVSDKDDECPELAGTVATKGCPDADGDGIADKFDACPNKAGEFGGCPDTDGDGVADNKDLCPTLAGPKKDAGCPDSDKDGLSDNNDKCPKTFGAVANGGCPWADTDGDGVTDNLDNCVNERGPKSNNGCPVKLTEEAKKSLGTYAKTIQFNSGKAAFKPGVTKTLDVIVKVMREFDGVRFDVEGHSDSSGNDAKNLKLSQERAQAVVDYLTSHGIANWRLNAVGYGETKPIASNNTAAGRALNRRVVLSAIEK